MCLTFDLCTHLFWTIISGRNWRMILRLVPVDESMIYTASHLGLSISNIHCPFHRHRQNDSCMPSWVPWVIKDRPGSWTGSYPSTHGIAKERFALPMPTGSWPITPSVGTMLPFSTCTRDTLPRMNCPTCTWQPRRTNVRRSCKNCDHGERPGP